MLRGATAAAIVALLVGLSACGGPKGLGCDGKPLPAAGLVPPRYQLTELPTEVLTAFRQGLDVQTSKGFSIDGVTVEPANTVYSITVQEALGSDLQDIAGQLEDLSHVRVAGHDGYVGTRAGRTVAIAKLGRCTAVMALGLSRKRTSTLIQSLAVGAGRGRREAPAATTRHDCTGAKALDLRATVPPDRPVQPASASVLKPLRENLVGPLAESSEIHGVQTGDLFVVAIDAKQGLIGDEDLASFPGRKVNFLGRPGRLQRTSNGALVYLRSGCSFVIVFGADRRGVLQLATKLQLD